MLSAHQIKSTIHLPEVTPLSQAEIDEIIADLKKLDFLYDFGYEEIDHPTESCWRLRYSGRRGYGAMYVVYDLNDPGDMELRFHRSDKTISIGLKKFIESTADLTLYRIIMRHIRALLSI
jgi:hypothetical protein